MAALLPDKSSFVELVPGTVVGAHLVTLVTNTGDTFVVPQFAQQTTANVSAQSLRRADGNTVTVTDNAATPGNTVTLVGTRGQQVVIATVHQSVTGFGDEDSANELF